MNDELRYMIDFDLIPRIIRNGQGKVVEFLLKDTDEAFCAFYNNFYRQQGYGRPFKHTDFLYRHIKNGSEEMIFVTLPETAAGMPMVCTHMAVTYYNKHGKYSDVRVFHIEKGFLGTTAIGEMQIGKHGVQGHANYGDASDNDDDNIQKIRKLAFFRGIPYASMSAMA